MSGIGMRRVPSTHRAFLLAFSALSLTACGHAPTASVSRTLAALDPRTVLVYLDLSGSMRRDALQEPLRRLATELRAGDRVIVYPITARTAADLAPVFDTTLVGSVVERVTAQLQLSTRRSRIEVSQRDAALSARLRAAASAAALQFGQSRATSIFDALCHAARTARADTGRPTIALVLTDGQESLRVNLSRSVPTPAAAARFGAHARAECDLAAPSLALRLIGVRHPDATMALLAWWRAALPALGYNGASDDVATHRLRPLLLSR